MDTDNNDPIDPQDEDVATPVPPLEPSPPEELGPMNGLFDWITALLRQPTSVADNLLNDKGPTGTNVFMWVFLICHAAYGLIMGLFSGDAQLYLVPLKMVLGTTVCALICFPSLFIFSCLSGAKVAPGKVFSILVGGLAVCSLLLMGFLPVSFIFTFSAESVPFMGLVHLGVWLVSIAFACRYIRKSLLLGVPQGNNFFYIWNIVMILTLLQMSTTLRPMLGPQEENQPVVSAKKKFFMVHWGDALDEELD